MFPSPAKRRKSNSSTAIPILKPPNDGQPSFNQDGRARPANRASFQSPTKASKARSQPELLSRVLGRSAAERTQRSEDRAIELQKGETEETLRIRSKRSISQSATDTNFTARETAEAPDARQQQEADSHVPPPSKVDYGGIRRSTRRALFSSRLPLARSQVSASSALPDVASIATRTQVREEVSEAQKAEDDEGEPELPPTPTQLGLQTLSLRSRVLTSSSPSLRLDQRKRRASQQRYVSSPLKPHDEEPVQGQVEDEEGGVSVAPPPEENVPKELLEKRKLRDELAAQLARLKEETASLEDFGQRLEQPDEYGPLDEVSIKRLLRLLTTDNPSCAPPPKPQPLPSISSMLSYLLPFSAPRHIPKSEAGRPATPPPENPFALEQPPDPLPYLTLFAPLSLSTHTTASSLPSSDPSQPSRLIQQHEFVLSPPPEFAQSIYRVPITIETDPEHQTILSISIPTSSQSPLDISSIPTQLRTWMDTRLSNPLLKLDISGLSWGVCRYWEACVSRAKLWVRLQKLRSQLTKDDNDTDDARRVEGEDPEANKRYAARVLVPHLDRSHFPISGPRSALKYEILVSCPIEIDLWTSEPYLQPDISLSIPESAGAGGVAVEKEARRVFWNMLRHGGAEVEVDCDAIVRAVEAVVGVLYGERG